MRSAAKFSGKITHFYDSDDVSVFFAEKGDCTGCFCAFNICFISCDGKISEDFFIDKPLKILYNSIRI